ncbi:coadhesin-like [Crassostrea angulata]|uniref:coadhesin-like n=1 Tax=Magallana angulata TaxID=2784310 RepID=UPI0022B2067D|nr:coadhesin-like [Crassostrea angulata]
MISTTMKILFTFTFVKTVSPDHMGPCGPGEEQYFTGNYPAAGFCRPSSGSSGSSSCSCSCLGTSGTFHGDWTPCSVSCGHGIQSRRGIRFDSCGSSHNLNPETRPCNQQPCPVNGGWSAWGQFTPCGKSCGGGIQVRFRSCDHPSPSNGGLSCIGDSLQTASCNSQQCQVNGGWGTWGQFTPCGKSCGGGIQVRFRSCDHPPPSNGGLPCYGNSLQTASCNNKVCPQLITLTNPISIETTTRPPSVNHRSYLNTKLKRYCYS